MVSKERLAGQWDEVVGAVRERFGEFTGDELQRVTGSAEQLIGLIQRKTGESREKIEKFVNSCCDSSGSALNRLSETAAEYADKAGETVRENYDRLSAEAQRGYDYSVRTMRRRPLESVALALGAGLLAGIVVGLSLTNRRR